MNDQAPADRRSGVAAGPGVAAEPGVAAGPLDSATTKPVDPSVAAGTGGRPHEAAADRSDGANRVDLGTPEEAAEPWGSGEPAGTEPRDEAAPAEPMGSTPATAGANSAEEVGTGSGSKPPSRPLADDAGREDPEASSPGQPGPAPASRPRYSPTEGSPQGGGGFVPQRPSATARMRTLLQPRGSAGQLTVALLVGLLGFAAVVQVRASEEDLLARARRADLVQILDGLTTRSERLEDDVRELEATRRELASGADSRQAAVEQAVARARQLGILAGTAAATGPGIVLSVTDPDGAVSGATLLSAVQELRDAGAEAIQIAGGNGDEVRVVASTYFLDAGDGVEVDGVQLTPPYRLTVIGDPATLATALRIPGGVVEEVAGVGGLATIREAEEVVVDVLHEPPAPQYARPAPEADGEGS